MLIYFPVFSCSSALKFLLFRKQQADSWAVLESHISVDCSISEFFATCSREGGIAVVAGKDEERSIMEQGTWLLSRFHCHSNGFLLLGIIWGPRVWLAVFLNWRGSSGTGVWREALCWVVYCLLAHLGRKALGSLWLSIHTHAYLCFPCARRSS